MNNLAFSLGLIVSIILCSCYKESKYEITKYTFDDLVSEIVIEKKNLLANFKDQSKVVIYIDSLIDITNFNFHVEISNGTFLSNKKDTLSLSPEIIIVDNVARRFIEFEIVSSFCPGISELGLNINDYVKIINFTFSNNLPDEINLIPQPSVIKRTRQENVAIEIELDSELGIPSRNLNISISAIDSLNNSIGRIFNDCLLQCDTNGCMVNYNIWPDTGYVGEILLIAKITNERDTIYSSTELFTIN